MYTYIYICIYGTHTYIYIHMHPRFSRKTQDDEDALYERKKLHQALQVQGQTGRGKGGTSEARASFCYT